MSVYMERRDILKFAGATIGGVSLLGGGAMAWTEIGTSENTQQEERVETVTSAPENVEAVRPLAQAFLKHITSYYQNARVFIMQDGQIAMEFQSKSDSGKEVNKEFHRIAVEYIRIINQGDYEPTTLTLVTSQVQAVVTQSAVRAHVSGEINQEAFLKTIEVMGVERRTESE